MVPQNKMLKRRRQKTNFQSSRIRISLSFSFSLRFLDTIWVLFRNAICYSTIIMLMSVCLSHHSSLQISKWALPLSSLLEVPEKSFEKTTVFPSHPLHSTLCVSPDCIIHIVIITVFYFLHFYLKILNLKVLQIYSSKLTRILKKMSFVAAHPVTFCLFLVWSGSGQRQWLAVVKILINFPFT